MRTRDVTIPLALWICAAIGAHFFLGTGGLVVAKVHDDRSELWKLARQAGSLAIQGEQSFEVSLGEPTDETTPPPPKPVPVAPLPSAKPPDPEAPKKAADKAPDKHVLALKAKPTEDKPVAVPEPLLNDRRIAVRQHAKANQEDNPSAHFVANEANHVTSESAATQTSQDRDEENPTPGGNHPGSNQQPGDSERTRIAENEDRAGAHNRAPGERGTDFDVVHEPKIPRIAGPPTSTAAQQAAAQTHAASAAAARASSPLAERAEPQPGEGGQTAPSPDVESVATGGWTFNRAGPGGAAGAAALPKAGAEGSNLPGGKLWSLPGLGQTAPPGALNVNLAQAQIAAVVGSDNLRMAREADGERRKSEHRGSWAASNFDRWRTAIENYVSSVKPGNQTALNTAAVPFASYLSGMHNRIHPIFSDSFVDSLDSLPPSHPMNDQHLFTRLEIVLTRQGHLRKMGVVRTSGITAFDIAALDAVDRAQPFGPAPGAIVSPDGNVYLHWEFHRDELRCSTAGARPFVLAAPPSIPEGAPKPPSVPPGPGKEENAPTSPNDAREGALPPRFRRGARWPG
jgi:TonB family protein